MLSLQPPGQSLAQAGASEQVESAWPCTSATSTQPTVSTPHHLQQPAAVLVMGSCQVRSVAVPVVPTRTLLLTVPEPPEQPQEGWGWEARSGGRK